MNIDKLKKVMLESYNEKVLRDLDGRTFTKPPWRQSHHNKSFNKRIHASFLHDVTEDDDAYVLDDDEAE